MHIRHVGAGSVVNRRTLRPKVNAKIHSRARRSSTKNPSGLMVRHRYRVLRTEMFLVLVGVQAYLVMVMYYLQNWATYLIKLMTWIFSWLEERKNMSSKKFYHTSISFWIKPQRHISTCAIFRLEFKTWTPETLVIIIYMPDCERVQWRKQFLRMLGPELIHELIH